MRQLGQLRRREPPRQLEQRERISARLGHDPIGHALVERRPQRRGQHGAGIVALKALHDELRQARELLAALARREHRADRLRQQPARNEGEHLRGRAIQPPRVVDEAQHWSFLRRIGEQAERRQPHEEAIRRAPRAQPERRSQRVALRSGAGRWSSRSSIGASS